MLYEIFKKPRTKYEVQDAKGKKLLTAENMDVAMQYCVYTGIMMRLNISSDDVILRWDEKRKAWVYLLRIDGTKTAKRWFIIKPIKGD